MLRRRYGWPRSFVRRPLEWLSRIAPEAADAFVPLDNLAAGLWELRPELQSRCDLRTHEGRSALLEWRVGAGIEDKESSCDLAEVAPFAAKLANAEIRERA